MANDLNPELALYAANGTLITNDSDSADGKNALLTYLVVNSGDYQVSVSSAANRGTYLLTVAGARGPELRRR